MHQAKTAAEPGHELLPQHCAWLAAAARRGMVCSMELPLAASSSLLLVGAHDITAVLRCDGSKMFVASAAILIRPALPLQQQQGQAIFATPLYRSDVLQPPVALVPHERALTPSLDDVALAEVDYGDNQNIKGIDEKGGDADSVAYALLQGDPVSGGGMKVQALGSSL